MRERRYSRRQRLIIKLKSNKDKRLLKDRYSFTSADRGGVAVEFEVFLRSEEGRFLRLCVWEKLVRSYRLWFVSLERYL